MNALQGMEKYWKEVIQVSTGKKDIKVQYLYYSSLPHCHSILSSQFSNCIQIPSRPSVLARQWDKKKQTPTKSVQFQLERALIFYPTL